MVKENVQNPKSVTNPSEDFRGIVHIVGIDVKGNVKLKDALRQVKGVGHNMANVIAYAVEKEMNIKKDTQIGLLSEEQIEKIEEIIKNPSAHGIKPFLLNRRKDLESGSDIHLSGTDFVFAVRNDIERHKNLYTWRGYRHAYGQKVRGPCT
ncbi:MAG: 30S ribosomal protein S13, partial [Candidatus Micrarchaeota archaeon]|nr:30S ribosomal protein S13 [Candidatus Micrarchaeota archaeon]